jgi:hypothetical protein
MHSIRKSEEDEEEVLEVAPMYHINPNDVKGLYKILDVHHNERNHFIETFMDRQQHIPVEEREKYRSDLMRYLAKQRQIFQRKLDG